MMTSPFELNFLEMVVRFFLPIAALTFLQSPHYEIIIIIESKNISHFAELILKFVLSLGERENFSIYQIIILLVRYEYYPIPTFLIKYRRKKKNSFQSEEKLILLLLFVFFYHQKRKSCIFLP